MKKCVHKWREVGRDSDCYSTRIFWCPNCGAISKGLLNCKYKTTYSKFYREKSNKEKD